MALMVWGITPASWVLVLLAIIRQGFLFMGLGPLAQLLFSRRSWVERLLTSRRMLLVAGCEIVFSLYHNARVKSVQMPVHSNRPTLDRIYEVFDCVLRDGLGKTPEETDIEAAKFMEVSATNEHLPKIKQPLTVDDPRAKWFRETFSLWFLGVKEEHITRADVEEWIAWALTGRHREDLKVASTNNEFGILHEMLAQALALIEARRGEPFPLHVNLSKKERENHRMMLLSLDSVRVTSHPLTHYVLVNALNRVLFNFLAWAYGVKVLKIGRIKYLYYCPSTWTQEQADKGAKPVALLFLHGLGVGALEYTWSICQILGSPRRPFQRPMLMPLQPWISNDVFSNDFLAPWDPVEASETIRAMLRRHDITRVNVLSHSMGTVTHTWMIKNLKDLLVRSCFVDPVSFELWAPHLCYRFMYKKPENGIEFGLRYFVARELGIAYTISRHFNWSNNVLLPNKDMPLANDTDRSRFYIAGSDSVFDAPRIRDYLARNGVTDTVHYIDGLPHGALIMVPNKYTASYVAWLDQPVPA